MITLILFAVTSSLQNVLEAVRKSFDVFFLRYPYCYGYWKKYADIEKKHENVQVAEEVNIKKTPHMHCGFFLDPVVGLSLADWLVVYLTSYSLMAGWLGVCVFCKLLVTDRLALLFPRCTEEACRPSLSVLTCGCTTCPTSKRIQIQVTPRQRDAFEREYKTLVAMWLSPQVLPSDIVGFPAMPS